MLYFLEHPDKSGNLEFGGPIVSLGISKESRKEEYRTHQRARRPFGRLSGVRSGMKCNCTEAKVLRSI